jgi:hypothetical protein
VVYKYKNRYIKYDLTPILRQNRISLMWKKDSEKSRSNSGTKFVPVKLYLVHKGSLEKISSYFDTFPVLQKIFKFFLVLPSQIK